MNATSLTLVRPKCFALSSFIITDHCICSIQYILGRTVILLKTDHLCFRVNRFKVQDISDVCSPELVNRLIIISHNTEIVMVIRQKPYQFKLCCVGILILIYHDIFETPLIASKDLTIRLKKLHRLHKQIIKIHGIALFESCLILPVCHCNFLFPIVSQRAKLVFLGGDQLVLCGGNRRKNSSLLQHFGVNLKTLADLLHD